jgi:hypothetical protein
VGGFWGGGDPEGGEADGHCEVGWYADWSDCLQWVVEGLCF